MTFSPNQDFIELRFFGNDLNPRSLRPKEVGEIISSFESALIAIIKRDHPTLDTQQVLISFTEITNKSAGFKFYPNEIVNAVVFSSYLFLTTSLDAKQYDILPTDAIKNLRTISNFITKKQCSAEFKLNEEIKTKIDSNTKIEISKDCLVKGETTIYATLNKIGGKDPKASFIYDNRTINIDVNKETAKILASKLYTTIGLKINADWHGVTSELITFSIQEIIQYSEGSPKEIFEELNNLLGKYWDNIDDVGEALFTDDDNF